MSTEPLADLKKVIATGKVVLGTSNTLKDIKTGKVASVYMSSNVPTDVKADITHYHSIGGFGLVQLETPNDELGTICRKSFSVSVLCVLK